MFFIFGNRACAWLPENRVKNLLAEKEILVGDSVAELMSCQGVDNVDVYRLLNEDGDVDFGQSNPNVLPKEYVITGIKGTEDFSITYALDENKDFAEVIGFDYHKKNCSSSLSNSNKSTVPLPHDEVMIILESKEMRILDKAQCEMKCYGLTEKQVSSFHKTATIVMSESEPRKIPNPHYVLKGKINGKMYKMKYIVGENRTRISDIWNININCNCVE